MKFPKILKYGTEARRELLEGMEIIADAVSATLGPRGQNVAIDQPHDYPQVIHDGVTVAKNIDLLDPFKHMGVEILKNAAQKTNDVAGDGTTTATVLAQAIVVEAMKHIEAGANPMQLKNEIDDALKLVLKALDELTYKITKDSEVEQIATIASADPNIGKMVAQALKKVGSDGTVTVEEGRGVETTVEYKTGLEIDRGYLSPYFVTDQGRQEAIIDNPFILLTDKKINHANDLLPFMNMFIKESGSKNLVIIAGEVIESAIQALVINKIRGTINVVAVQAPAFGDRRVDELVDISALVGGKPLMDDEGRELSSVTLEELGRAERVVADRDKTIIINGAGKKKDIENRAAEIRKQIAVPNTDFDKDIKESRLANLAGKVAVIHAGAATEIEVKDKKERIIDAVNATKAAISDGIVAGGQITLLNIATMPFWETIATPGSKILKEAVKKPFKKLVENAGLDYAEVWGQISPIKYPIGIDVIDGQKKDLIKAGIIDPVKVERSALKNAVSVSTMAITTKVLIADDPEGKE